MEFNSIGKVINRVLFCTSPLQVINARSVMDSLGNVEDCNDYVVIIHRRLSDSSKKSIKQIANKLDYKGVFDLSFLHNQHQENIEKNFSLTNGLFSLQKLFLARINNHLQLQNKISELLSKKIGNIDFIFFRINYRRIDSLFICTQNSAQFFGVEDGLGDYASKFWFLSTFNTYEIKSVIKWPLHRIILFIISSLFTGRIIKSKEAFLLPKFNYYKKFTNLKSKGNVCVKEYFVNNLKKLFKENLEQKNMRIMIIGSLVAVPFNFGLTLEREVEIYNSLIELIVKKHKVNYEQIWYKPHPRLDYENWFYKSQNLNCSLYPFGYLNLTDVELLYKDLLAVYSVGSTSLLYAHNLFNIKSYLVDIRNEDCHPVAYEKYYHIAKKFGIPAIIV